MVNTKQQKKILLPPVDCVATWLSRFSRCPLREQALQEYSNAFPSNGELTTLNLAYDVVPDWHLLQSYPFVPVVKDDHHMLEKSSFGNAQLPKNCCIPAHATIWHHLINTVYEKKLVIIIPPKKNVTIPLTYITALHDNQYLFNKIYCVVGAQSRVTIIDTLQSHKEQQRAFCGRAITCIVEEYAHLAYRMFNHTADTTVTYNSFNCIAHAHAQAHLFLGMTGGAATIIDATLHSIGQGAEMKLDSVYALNAYQQLLLRTHQMHKERATKSHVCIKGVLRGQAWSNYDGMVTIAPQADNTIAHQESAVLFLSADAKARAVPALEVQAHEIQCSHGSAFGGIRSDYLMYLQARGIDPIRAQHIFIEGFFAPLLEKVNTVDTGDSKSEGISNQLFSLKELQRRCYEE